MKAFVVEIHIHPLCEDDNAVPEETRELLIAAAVTRKLRDLWRVGDPMWCDAFSLNHWFLPNDQHLHTLDIIAPSRLNSDDALACVNRAVQHELRVPAMKFNSRVLATFPLERQDI